MPYDDKKGASSPWPKMMEKNKNVRSRGGAKAGGTSPVGKAGGPNSDSSGYKKGY